MVHYKMYIHRYIDIQVLYKILRGNITRIVFSKQKY